MARNPDPVRVRVPCPCLKCNGKMVTKKIRRNHGYRHRPNTDGLLSLRDWIETYQPTGSQLPSSSMHAITPPEDLGADYESGEDDAPDHLSENQTESAIDHVCLHICVS